LEKGGKQTGFELVLNDRRQLDDITSDDKLRIRAKLENRNGSRGLGLGTIATDKRTDTWTSAL